VVGGTAVGLLRRPSAGINLGRAGGAHGAGGARGARSDWPVCARSGVHPGVSDPWLDQWQAPE
jgi:hypothetical protein